MKTIVIDGGQLTSPEQAHRYLAEKLNFPDYYGMNLDALYDCLGDVGQEVCLVLYRVDQARQALGAYCDALLEVIEDAAKRNTNIAVVFDSVL